MDEKKWISPHLIAGYGLATWIGYHAMQKVAIAFSDLGSVNGLGIGGFTGTWGHIASSSLFVPCVCILSVIPLVIHICSYIPRTWTIRASKFRSDDDEFQEYLFTELVDSSRQDEFSQNSVVSYAQDTSCESGRSNRVREDGISEVADIISLQDEKSKRSGVHNRGLKRRK